jgi:hypothetical protein
MDVRTFIDSATIYLARHGSHAYGTALPTSDHDVRGVAIPPKPYYLGCLHRFEQHEQKGDPDVVIFELRKFMGLAMDCNPNVLEILFVDESDRLKVTPEGEELLASRRLFLSKKARHTFSGYAISQLKRIETHRRWLLHPPAAPPTRAEFGLPERTVISKDQLAAAESMMRKQVESWQVDLEPLDEASKIQLTEKLAAALAEMRLGSEDAQILCAGRSLGFDDNFLDLLDRERRYTTAQRSFEQYQHWLRTRNAARAELAARHGYDTKHGMHLVRLMRMCRELLEEGELRVRRPDAEELLSIRRGTWSYDRLMQWAREQEAALDSLYKTSKLPSSPDRAAIDALCVRLVEAVLKRGA